MTKILAASLALLSLVALHQPAQAVTLTLSNAASSSGGTYTPGDYGSIQAGVPDTTLSAFPDAVDGLSPEIRHYGEFDLAALPSNEVITDATLHFSVDIVFGTAYDFDISLYTGADANGLIEASAVGHNDGSAPNNDFDAGTTTVATIMDSADAQDFSQSITGAALTALKAGPSFAGFEFQANDGADTSIDILPHSSASGGSANIALEVDTTQRPVADVTNTSDTTFASNDLSITLDGTASTDPDGANANLSYTWSAQSGGQNATTALDLGDSGITQPGGSATISLAVVDKEGAANDPAADAPDNSLEVTYQNSAPSVTLDSAENQGGGDWKLTFDVSDPDFAANSEVFGFESVSVDLLDDGNNTVAADIVGPLTSDGTDLMATVNLMGEMASQFFIRVTDNGLGGTSGAALTADSDTFSTAVAAIPEPASLALWSLIGLCLGGYVLRRRK